MSEPAKDHLLIVGIVGGAVLLWYAMLPAPEPVGAWREGEPARALKQAQRATVAPPKVAVYAAPAKQRLDLPPAIQQDAHQHLLAATRVPASDHPQTVATLLDDQSGHTQTLVRREPLPWLAAEQRGELRVDYGVKNGMRQVLRLSLSEDLVALKALHAGVQASLDSDGAAFVGAGVGWRW